MAEPAADRAFRKDMSHLTWDEVFARQRFRADLLPFWFEGLELAPGRRVLDIGAGPGFVSLALAERVGPAGTIFAVDRSAEALAYLARMQAARGIAQIARLAVDAAGPGLEGVRADSALVTLVLHHADAPEAIVRNVARLLPAGAPAVIGEFHPDGPCERGAPREFRIAPATVAAWCEAAGLSVTRYRRLSGEHYMTVARRRAR